MSDLSDVASGSPWSLAGHRVALEYCGLTALVDAATPSRGLTRLEFRGHAMDGQLLGVDIGCDAPPDDVHIRGADFVAIYRELPDRPYTVEVYWSVSSRPEGEVILDATVSIQTRQWEAYPSVIVASHLAGAESAVADAAIQILRPGSADWSFVEVVPVEDFQNEGPVGASATAWRFGPQFMERGVIRRLRVRGGIVARNSDEGAAQRLQAELQTEAPPLTA